MAITVTCAKCLTRFNVSDKFAGQEGPCPKCKAVIRVPDASQEVKVHGPHEGPTDTTGRAVSKPIFRQETPITAVHWTLAACLAFLLLAIALIARNMFEAQTFPFWAMGLGAFLISLPMAFLGYALFRDPEVGSFSGSELWGRVAICGALFSLTWVLSPIMAFAFTNDIMTPGALSQGVALIGLLFAGGAVSMLTFDLDYLMGVVHAGIYLIPCILMRLLAGLDAIPGLSTFGDGATPTNEKPVFGMLLLVEQICITWPASLSNLFLLTA